MANMNGCLPSTNRDIEKSSANEAGWYIYGAKDAAGTFVVQSIAPRALLRLQPDEYVVGKKKSGTPSRRKYGLSRDKKAEPNQSS